MLEKKIKFVDFDGNAREGTYYFNLNKAEVIMWLSTSGEYTLDKVLLRLSEERNGKKIMETFEDLIHRSYGRKSLDGISFEKDEDSWKAFYQSGAYSELFTEIVTDAAKAAKFVNGIIPSEMAKEVSKAMLENKDGLPSGLKDYVPEIVSGGESS